MSPFEFVFSLFGLMLGLSLAEVLGGLVRFVKARGSVRLGWLTPLLALFVMLDLTSFWANAWSVREIIPAHYGTLVAGLAATGLYYLSASLVFPDRPEDCADLDDHYFLRRRAVLGGVALCNAGVIAAMLVGDPRQVTSPAALVVHTIYYAMIAIAAFARPRWANIAALIVLVLVYASFALFSLADG